MKRPILFLALLALGLIGCSSGSEGPGDTVPGPPRDLVEKGSKPPVNGPAPGVQQP